MMKNKLAKYFTFAILLIICFAQIAQGAEFMENMVIPVLPLKIDFNDFVISLFPVSQDNSFGMIAGRPDHETLRIGTVKGRHLKENVIPRHEYDAAEEIGTCVNDCSEMYMSSCRILRWVDWKGKKKKEKLTYWGVGDVLQNEYLKTKLIDPDRKIVLTVFSPNYNDEFDIVNFYWSLTLEDLINKKRVKSLPISTESGEYKTAKKADFPYVPNAFFGSDYVIYRESKDYKWLSVNNNLDYIDHPLKKVLNDNPQFFATEFVSIEISNDKPFAITVCQNPVNKNSCVAITQWNKTPAITPVPLKLNPDERIEDKSLTLSPSGKWAHFNTSAQRHLLMYIDPNLPIAGLPPLLLPVETEIGCKFTWITQPEGFVLWNGNFEDGKMFYWDLSKVDLKGVLRR